MVRIFLESTILSELKYHYLIMIERKGDRRKRHGRSVLNGTRERQRAASIDAAASATAS